MIKLICPKCMKPVPVADDFTGREVTCPACSTTFDAPSRYTPAVLPESPPAATASPPAPPPVPVTPPTPPTVAVAPAPVPVAPPGYVPPAPPAPPQSAVPTPAVEGYTRSCGITISPRAVAWAPAVFLTVTFFCTFFPWLGAYLGGYAVHSQGPWRAMFGSVGTNAVLAQYMPGDGTWLKQVPSDVGLMLGFLFFLVVAMLFAWADRGLHSLDPRKVPPLAKLWPWRKTVIGVSAGLALLFVLIQVANGFGMERAIRKSVRDNPEIVKLREEAAGSPSKEAAVENREDADVAKFNLSRTWWQDVALASLLVAVAAVPLAIILDRRGTKPPPRIVLHY